MMYKQANIHQRINAKNNARFLYSYANLTLARIVNRDTDIYNGTRLMLRSDQQHYGREYYEADYGIPSQDEISERMYKIQRELKW